MGQSSRRLLVLTAIAGLIGTTVVVAGTSDTEKSYLPSQTQAKTQVKAPGKAQAPSADKPAKHKRHKVAKVKTKRHAHKRHRRHHHHRYAGGDFGDALLFLPRLVFGLFH
jgi:hypothetical protein